MSQSGGSPITAESLRRRDEWRLCPGSITEWEDSADEGDGIGFDNLDPSAMVRVLARTTAPWSDIVGWYRGHLEAMGWQGLEVRPHTWWRWIHAGHVGERISVLDRSDPDVPSIVRRVPGTTLYEVLYTARGDAGVGSAPDA